MLAIASATAQPNSLVFGSAMQAGDLTVVLSPQSTFNIAPPGNPEVFVIASIQTADPNTTGFKITVVHRAGRFVTTVVRSAVSPYTSAYLPFSYTDVISVRIEEQKPVGDFVSHP